jgi:hypothetical protein
LRMVGGLVYDCAGCCGLSVNVSCDYFDAMHSVHFCSITFRSN